MSCVHWEKGTTSVHIWNSYSEEIHKTHWKTAAVEYFSLLPKELLVNLRNFSEYIFRRTSLGDYLLLLSLQHTLKNVIWLS